MTARSVEQPPQTVMVVLQQSGRADLPRQAARRSINSDCEASPKFTDKQPRLPRRGNRCAFGSSR
jgi:hypothetical protein